MLLNSALNARYCAPPHFAIKEAGGRTEAQKAGLRYEAKALLMLQQWCKGHRYIGKVQPWIQYVNALNEMKYCQPDFLAISLDTDNLLVIEIKHNHTRTAFEQLSKYKDMVKDLHPLYTPSLIEVCRTFDSAEHSVELLPELRPHDYPKGAAVIWDPRWTTDYN